jgi:putative transposase
MMTNHVHLLCTPRVSDAVSKMMQSLGRRYVQYFNCQYKRSGTLWEGRFKSCLVQDEYYLLQLCKYIELNPVRAKIVNDPGLYLWSSYQINGLGQISTMWTPHQEYLHMGKTDLERQKAYRMLFKHGIDDDLVKEVQESTQKSMAIGSDSFKDHLEILTGRRMRAKKRGRPVGWRKSFI